MTTAATVYGPGYTAQQPRPDQIQARARTTDPSTSHIAASNAEASGMCGYHRNLLRVACHNDGLFSYWSDTLGAWIANDTTVPQDVLDALPDDERNRVMKAMTAAGVVAA